MCKISLRTKNQGWPKTENPKRLSTPQKDITQKVPKETSGNLEGISKHFILQFTLPMKHHLDFNIISMGVVESLKFTLAWFKC